MVNNMVNIREIAKQLGLNYDSIPEAARVSFEEFYGYGLGETPAPRRREAIEAARIRRSLRNGK